MSETALHPTPTLWAAATEQLRAVGIAIRREAAAVAVLVAAPTLAALFYAWRASDSLSFGSVEELTVLGWLAATAAALAPLAVWKGEERFGSSHLWLLPVDHRRHALLKVGAGWAWLMVALAAVLLWLFVVTVLSGGSFGVAEERVVLDASHPSGARSVTWMPPAWQWIAVFTGASAIYLLGSALQLAVRQPWRWIAGAVVLAAALWMIVVEGRIGWLYDAGRTTADQLTVGAYGLDALLTGGAEGLESIQRLPTGEWDLVWLELPSLGRWAGATLLWTGIGLATLLGAASRPRQG